LNAVLLLTKITLSRRPTGWHDESGVACSGGHVTVKFWSSSGSLGRCGVLRRGCRVTHHIYPTDDAYAEKGRRTRRRRRRRRNVELG
jgi:hypothetical protein